MLNDLAAHSRREHFRARYASRLRLLAFFLSLVVLFSCKSSTVPEKTVDELKAEQFINETIQKNADVDEVTIFPDQPVLLTAARFGWIDAVRLLLSHGADPNTGDGRGSTALHEAADSIAPGSAAIVELLIHYGARPTANDSNGRTPLHLAARAGNKSAAELLLNNGAAVTATDVLGFMPIHDAARAGSTEVIVLLLDRGADVNTPGEMGWTPLHMAAMQGYIDPLRTLLARGANPEARDASGLTALDWCEKNSTNPRFTKDKKPEKDFGVALYILRQRKTALKSTNQ